MLISLIHVHVIMQSAMSVRSPITANAILLFHSFVKHLKYVSTFNT